MSRALTALAACALVLLAACGGSSGSGQSSSAAPLQPITVDVGAVDPSFTQVFIGSTEGYYAKEGLTVTIEVAGTALVNNVVAGRADLGVLGTPSSFLPVRDGKQTSVVYNNAAASIGGWMAGLSSISKVADCKRVVTSAIGTSGYGYAQLYKTATHASYDIVGGDVSNILPSVLSKQADCAVTSPAQLQAGLNSGQIHLIVDPTKPSTLPAGVSTDLVGGTVWGMTDNLKTKRASIVAFLKAFQKALEFMKKANDAQVAASLRKDSNWQPIAADKLTGLVQVTRFSWAPNKGEVPAAAWPSTLQFLSATGLTYVDPNDSKWSYNKMVDMSYLKAAGG